jgi:hypothetical protein
MQVQQQQQIPPLRCGMTKKGGTTKKAAERQKGCGGSKSVAE